MEAAISRIVMNIDSVINKSNVASDIKSILDTKKRRTTSDEDYVDSLLVNNGFINIKTDTIIDLVSKYILSENALDQNTFNHYYNMNVENVKNTPENDIVNKFGSSYNKFANINAKIDQLQFDYKFASYYMVLIDTLLDKSYIELHSVVSKHRCSPSDVFNALRGIVFKCAKNFSNNY